MNLYLFNKYNVCSLTNLIKFVNITTRVVWFLQHTQKRFTQGHVDHCRQVSLCADVSLESKCTSPYGWCLHTEAGHPCRGHRSLHIPSQAPAFAPFAEWSVDVFGTGFVIPPNTFHCLSVPFDTNSRPRELLCVKPKVEVDGFPSTRGCIDHRTMTVSHILCIALQIAFIKLAHVVSGDPTVASVLMQPQCLFANVELKPAVHVRVRAHNILPAKKTSECFDVVSSYRYVAWMELHTEEVCFVHLNATSTTCKVWTICAPNIHKDNFLYTAETIHLFPDSHSPTGLLLCWWLHVFSHCPVAVNVTLAQKLYMSCK